jgi:DNA-binding IclR family transcriptional regulator
MSRKTTTDYTNESQQRLIKLVLVLFGDVVNGYPPSVLAKTMNCTATIVTRDMHNLVKAGVAERDEATGNCRLTPRLPQQAIKVFNAIDHAERRLAEARQRFSRNPD